MNRKEIVHSLAEHLEAAPAYLGAPGFAYQVGDYTVDRHSNILDAQGQKVELEELLKGTLPEDEAESIKGASKTEEPVALEIGLPLEGYRGKSLRNLIRIIYGKQPLIKKALGLETDLVGEEAITALNQEPMSTLDHFRKAMEGINCPGIDFDFERETITFKLGRGGDDPDKVEAATHLLALINKSARRLKRNASAKVKPADNEKYTFRTWLVRLGMVGDEYKTTRKVLLKNLSGNTAFRTKTKEEA